MVPYVRKSFRKHWQTGLKYCCDGIQIKGVISADTPIESDIYKTQPKAYQYAMDMTVKEIQQAVEGMYHNLK